MQLKTSIDLLVLIPVEYPSDKKELNIMKKSELKTIIRECIEELNEVKEGFNSEDIKIVTDAISATIKAIPKEEKSRLKYEDDPEEIESLKKYFKIAMEDWLGVQKSLKKKQWNKARLDWEGMDSSVNEMFRELRGTKIKTKKQKKAWETIMNSGIEMFW